MDKINPLTGLYFGSAYFSKAESFIKTKEAKKYCMIAIDIEHFRLYNTIHGRKKADAMLVEIANTLKKFQEVNEALAGYMGGDNFVLLTEYDQNRLKNLRKEIRDLLRTKNKTTGYPPAYGVYVIDDVNLSPAVMYQHATIALSYVIGNYTNRCMEYYPDMDGRVDEEIRLLSDIQEGIENDEFTFFIQPQYDIVKDKIVGGESLVRWNSKTKGFVSPGVFIPVLEKNGFIADLDQVVWEKVCQWLKNCIDKGYEPVPLSINVSRIDIFALDVPEFLMSLIERYELSPELIKVEITESAYAEEGDIIVETAKRLKELGFLVMMDDFGSGYSSLNMLKSMPVDVIKMDMRFLEINDQEKEKGIGILESVVNMARQMQIPIVVEGVETKEQENLLKKMGCCYTQGFFYYKPMSAERFEELISDNNNLDHSGFWYCQAESVHLREFLDTNLFNDNVINHILGPAVFYDMYENTIEITRVNEQYFELAGITQEDGEDYRQRFWNSVRDDDRQLLYSIFAQAYENPTEGASGYINFVRRDGETLWVHIKVFLLREKEEHKLFYASLTDMTELKHQQIQDKPMLETENSMKEEEILGLDAYYGNLPCGFAIAEVKLNKNNKPVDYVINYANSIFARLCGGDIERLRMLIEMLFVGKEKEFLEAGYRAAFKGENVQLHVYSNVSNRYFDIHMSQYRYGYAACMLQDETRTQIYQGASNSVMATFREVYYIELLDNHCRMIYPDSEDLLERGNYEEIVSRHFDTGKIIRYDEENVRKFLSLENLRKELILRDNIEYKYKRSVYPLGDEWCQVMVSVSERKEDGTPKTATMTIRSIETLMREKEDQKRQNMAISLASMSDGFFVYSAAHGEKIVFANSAVINIFGCTDIDDFRAHVKESFMGLVHPEDLNRVEWEIVEQQKSSDKNLDFIRYRIIRKDGEVRWLEDVGYLEKSSDGELHEMFYVFVSDITDTMLEQQKNKLILQSQQFNKKMNEI